MVGVVLYIEHEVGVVLGCGGNLLKYNSDYGYLVNGDLVEGFEPSVTSDIVVTLSNNRVKSRSRDRGVWIWTQKAVRAQKKGKIAGFIITAPRYI